MPVVWDGWISLAEPKPKESGAGNPVPSGAGLGGIEEDIPF